MCGVVRLRPPWREGSSWALVRALEAYRSRNREGKGGREEEGAASCFRFRLFLGGWGVPRVVVEGAAVAGFGFPSSSAEGLSSDWWSSSSSEEL